MDDPEDALSMTEAGVLLGRSAQEVEELIEEGELRFLPTTDLGSIRVPRSAIDEFLKHDPG